MSRPIFSWQTPKEESSMSKKYITVTYLHEIEDDRNGTTGELRVHVTQDYSYVSDSGHIKAAITDDDGNLVHIMSTTGGPPKGKATKETAKEVLDDYLRWAR